jgi:ATP-dependent RNA helicase RhlE
MLLPLRVEVAPSGTTVKQVTQELFFVDSRDKISLLANILKQYTGSILIFSRTKFGAKKITHKIRALGYTANEIHSNRTLNQRLEALEGFKIGRYRILVATDIAARGIDVSNIQLVLNYDLPENPEDYIHRIGRTARAGRTGHAISFATPDQRGDIKGIERLIRTALPVSPTPVLPKIAQPPMQSGFKQAPARPFQKSSSHYRLGRFAQKNSQNRNNSYGRRRNRKRPNRSSIKKQWSNG